MSTRSASLLSLAGALFAACTSAPPPAAPPPSAPARDEATALAIERALAGDHRSDANRARDPQRHPIDTLLFFGIKPEMTVVEAWPDAGGWYTEVLAPLLAGGTPAGKLYAALPPEQPGNVYRTRIRASFVDQLAARPDLYGQVEVTGLGPEGFAPAPPGSADLVVTFRSLHGWMSLGQASEALAALHAALKPRGVLGVVDHRADPARPVDPRAANGYVNEEYAVWLIEAAGFRLEARSEINANPRDTKDHEQGVWALPPGYRAGNRDRAKYAAIGESDRFTLKFRKR